ncbi:hypothetical protein BGZ95_007485 [Linnemannia exigua]|uniref:P-loop containing nucleoside triphosphate hydrolase protein n=1 Tax=Linnemannia exigua TaxID=604196 RepID=A0AAD4H8Z7_9FUNG|nr:hypothetical protein BGZ95_007485 [Linnemannia exigua]
MARKIVESVYGEAFGQQGKALGSKIIRAENKKAPSATSFASLVGSGSGSGSAKAKKNNKKKGAKGSKGSKTGTKSGAQGGGVPQVLDPAAIKKREKKAREAFRAGRVLLEKLVEGSDVVIVVLDVRDPQRCRSTFLEKLVHESGKSLVFVLNKTDMVPGHNVERWLEVLRQEHTTVPFNAVESSSNSADALAQLLKSQSISSENKKASFTVGIVGFPSVGRASVLRSLRQSKELSSSSSIKFYVNLGALLNKGGHGPIDSMLRSKLLPNDDLVSATASIIMRCKQQSLMITYSVPRFDTGKEFLESLARQQGHLFKGGVPDTLTAARSFLRELSSGKSPFYTNPPTSTTGTAKKTKGKGYGVDVKLDEPVLRAMEFSDERGFSFTLAAQNGLEEDPEDDGEEEDEVEAPMLIPALDKAKKVQSKKQTIQEQDMDEEVEEEDLEEEDLEEDEDEDDDEDKDEIVPSTTTKRGAKSAPVQKRPVKKAKKTTAIDEDGDAPYTFGEFA